MSSDLVKRSSPSELMAPPPPPKRIKRPAKVLDEDDYTDALSQIIARDFFPGLLESKTQREYLAALESDDPAWIAEAGAKLQAVMTPGPETRARAAQTARNTRFQTAKDSMPSETPDATPLGYRGAATPTPGLSAAQEPPADKPSEIDTANLSLSSFQAKYTSEDNESFAALLDGQNNTRRSKHAYLFTPSQRLPSKQQLLQYKTLNALAAPSLSSSTALALSSSLTASPIRPDSSRPARPDAWERHAPNPANNLMFLPPSVDESQPSLPLLSTEKESESRMPPRTTNLSATRLPPPPPKNSRPVPPSPSLSSIDAAIAGRPRLTASEVDGGTDAGGETPRVNGYAFVEEDDSEDEREKERERERKRIAAQPTYRDLLAGQVETDGSGGANPFKVQEKGGREKLHHRLVRRAIENQKAMTNGTGKDAGTDKGHGDGPRFFSSPVISKATPRGIQRGTKGKSEIGNLTPAGRRLLERVGRTPVSAGMGAGKEKIDMWTPTPGRTPRTPKKEKGK